MNDSLDISNLIINKLNELKIDKKTFAYLIRSTPATFEKMLERNSDMNIDVIYKIARFIDVEPQELAKLEYDYREKTINEKDYIEEYEKIKNIYSILADRNFVQSSNDIIEVVKNYNRFMEVVNVDILEKDFSYLNKFGLSCEEKLAIMTWSQIGLRKIRKIEFNQNYNRNNEELYQRVNDLRYYIDKEKIDEQDFKQKIIKIFLDYDVFLNFEKTIIETKIECFSKILNDGKIIIQLVDSNNIDKLIKNALNEYYIITVDSDKNIHFS